jgi:uncharacterized protein (TIGR02145 family)
MITTRFLSFPFFCFILLGLLSMMSCAVETGVVINGVYWAKRNVDAPGTFAAAPEKAGMFYQWNKKKAWPATGRVINWESGDKSGESWEATNDPCPAGWRVPTNLEFIHLLNETKVDQLWTTQKGVNGMRFTDKASGHSVFFPAVTYRRFDGLLDTVGGYGEYWSSSPAPFNDSWDFGFGSRTASRVAFFRGYGFSVRCVRNNS